MLRAVLVLSHAAARVDDRRAAAGRIVNVSSVAAFVATLGRPEGGGFWEPCPSARKCRTSAKQDRY